MISPSGEEALKTLRHIQRDRKKPCFPTFFVLKDLASRKDWCESGVFCQKYELIREGDRIVDLEFEFDLPPPSRITKILEQRAALFIPVWDLVADFLHALPHPASFYISSSVRGAGPTTRWDMSLHGGEYRVDKERDKVFFLPNFWFLKQGVPVYLAVYSAFILEVKSHYRYSCVNVVFAFEGVKYRSQICDYTVKNCLQIPIPKDARIYSDTLHMGGGFIWYSKNNKQN